MIPPGDFVNQDGQNIDGGSPRPGFIPRISTFILLFFLIVIWPGISLVLLFLEETEFDLSGLDPVFYIYLPTIVIQWLIFLAVFLVKTHEKATFRSLGFTRLKISHLFSALGFVLVSNIVLSGLQVFLGLLGLEISRDVDLIVEQAARSAWWWLAVSITAAICEETAFRGYIMTRIKGILGRGWLIPILLSTISFAAGHTYQGGGGLLLIFVYGLMFCGLYIYTGSLWPGILAHFIQDFSAIFLYKYLNV